MSDSEPIPSIGSKNELELRRFMNSPDFQANCDALADELAPIIDSWTPLQVLAALGLLDQRLMDEYGVSLAEMDWEDQVL